jgi:hypothetical protein
MPSNLAQNLEQKSRGPTPALTDQDFPHVPQGGMGPSYTYDSAPQLPPIDTDLRPGEGAPLSPQYSLSSGVEEYLKSDNIPAPTSRGLPGPSKNDPYSTAQPLRNDPYSSYNASAYPPPQPPFVDEARPRSRSNSAQGKYPQPPPMVDYARQSNPGDPPSSRARTSYQQLPPQQDQYPPAAQQARPGGNAPIPSRPYSQDYSGNTPPRQTTPRPNRASAAYPQPSSRPNSQDTADAIRQSHRLSGSGAQRPISINHIDMPEPFSLQFADLTLTDPRTDPRYSPNVRPVENAGQSPRLQPLGGRGPAVSPPPLAPKTDYEWEAEIEGERDLAIRSENPNVALPWAEKVYMYVSITLEEMRRNEDGRAQTPTLEKGLRADCVRIVEKFVRMQNPKAVPHPCYTGLMGRFICVGFGLIMGILGIRMIDTRRITRTPCPPNKATSARNIVSGKCIHTLLCRN